jgi:exopolysaccharide biosynthesis polyprenyl glycosylphosphotransferase
MKHVAKLFDLFAIAIAIVLATVAVHPSPEGITVAGFLAMRIKLGNGLLFLLLLTIWHNIFAFCGLYISKRLSTWRTDVSEVCKGTLLASALLVLIAKACHMNAVRPLFVLVFWLVLTSLMVAARLLARPVLLFLRSRGRNTRFVLIFGTNERAIEFADNIARRPELGYRIVGFVDEEWAGTAAFDASGHHRCCNFDGLADLLRMDVVDEAAMYLPLRSYYEHAAQLVSLCEQHGIVIRFDSQIFNFKSAPSQDADFEGSAPILLPTGSADGLQAMVKRTFDIVFSFLLLAITSPLFLVVAALIKLTSPGPVFFNQTRVGLNKRQFRFHKFRTMIQDAEKLQEQLLAMNEMDGPVFKIAKDPRITPLGGFLRKTSIDELPQLWNVLIGDMSLVGPRAMSLRDYRLFEEDWQRRRFSVKPGITCLWQIHGRNSIPFEQWMELDMQYIDKWSLWLDLKILARTVPAVLRGTGAA